MPTIVPTFADVPWGTLDWQRFDYFKHPFQDPKQFDEQAGKWVGGNPLLMMRHGGGGTAGDYRYYRTFGSGTFATFLRWLQDNPHGVHFDYCSIGSGQRSFDWSPMLLQRSQPLYFPAAFLDLQRARAAIKARHLDFGFDPDNCHAGGNSYGATVQTLAQLYPAWRGAGGDAALAIAGAGRTNSFDSTVRSVLAQQPQVSIAESIPGTDYMDFINVVGWLGTRTDDSGAEFHSVPMRVRKAFSILELLAARQLDGAVPMFTLYQTSGDGVHPFVDPHDAQQRIDLNDALAAAGVQDCDTRLYVHGDLDNNGYPGNPTNPSQLATYTQLYAWLSARALS